MPSNIEYRGNDRKKMKHQLWLYGLKLLDIIMVTAPFAVCWYIFYAENINNPFFAKGNWLVIAMFAVLYLMLCKLYNGLKISIIRMSEIVYSQSLSLLIADVFMYFVISLLSSGFVFVPPMLLMLIIQVVMSGTWTFIAHRTYFKRNKPLRTVVIWDMREGLEKLVKEYKLDRRFDVIGTVHADECVNNIQKTLQDAEAIFLCGIHSTERNKIVKYCISTDIKVYVIPRIGDVIMSSAKPVHMFHLPIMELERYNPSPGYVILKRLFDIIISGIGLIVLSPLMLVIAILIKQDGGTVFYKQKRLTQHGREFSIVKFRTMRMDAEKDGVARLSTGDNDDRLTPVGKRLRKFRGDEIPQLLCCLLGTLSLVGPRPERPEIAAQYEEEMPEFALRLQAKAGLTGLAQVYGKYNTTPYDKLLMDLQYIANPSLFEDLKIMFATVKILFLPESTEGVAEGQTTAVVRKVEKKASEKSAEQTELVSK